MLRLAIYFGEIVSGNLQLPGGSTNSIGPCPTELDTLDSNIEGQDQDGLRATGLIQRHQAA